MDVKFKIKNEGCSLSSLYSEFNVNSRVIKKELYDNVLHEVAEIYYQGADLDKILASLKSSQGLIGFETLYSNDKILIVKLLTHECPVLGIMKKYADANKPIYKEEEEIKGENNTWHMSLASVDIVKELSEKLRNVTGQDVIVNIYKKSKVDRKSLFVIKEAYDLGFFDVPKRINLLELSATLNIPPTTLDLIIRRSLKYFLDMELIAKDESRVYNE